MSDKKSDTIELRVNGEPLAEFIVDKLAIQITRREVVIRGECRDTYADKVFLNGEALDALGYAPDGSNIPPVRRPSWMDYLRAAVTGGTVTGDPKW